MGGFFEKTGFESSGIRNLTPRQALTLCQQGAILVDVREEYMNCFNYWMFR
ncbi:MAG: hypothetical protein NT040_19860 [Bacteroidetes bacterium]|nr:hypothetical protein [Bacteroidota bacterium]